MMRINRRETWAVWLSWVGLSLLAGLIGCLPVMGILTFGYLTSDTKPPVDAARQQAVWEKQAEGRDRQPYTFVAGRPVWLEEIDGQEYLFWGNYSGSVAVIPHNGPQGVDVQPEAAALQ
jgi:hypothetical protein